MIIPYVQARTFEKALLNARTRPAVFSCQHPDGERVDYVVKFHGQLGSCIVCELLAALLGQQLGLPIPPIAVVEISSHVINAIPGSEVRHLPVPGLHFGSRYVTEGYTTWLHHFSIPANALTQAQDIFAFDMLIQNPDRSHRGGKRPNILFDGNQFIIFDHELAFSFLTDLLPSPKPWELRNLPFVREHVFHNQLARYSQENELTFDGFLERVVALSDHCLDQMVDVVPEGWRNPNNASKIKAHLVTIRDNISRFKRGLLEALV